MVMYNGINRIHIHSTRYPGLGFANTNPAGTAIWRVIDCHEEGREASVGPQYKTKTELLADLDRYAKTWGY
jgi:hypothetical protein